MTESDDNEITPEESSVPPLAEEDSTGDPWLDKLLSEGILKGQARMGLAQVCLAGFMILSLGWITFSGAASSPFLLGDYDVLVGNESLHQIATISNGWGEQIRPISALTFALNWVVGDGEPFAFQFSQIIFHLLNALLVYLLCRFLVRGYDSEAIPMAAGLIFAVHPLSAYAVNTLVERDLIFGTFFMLGSLVLFASAIQSERIGWIRITLSLITFGLSWACVSWSWVTTVFMVLLVIALDGWAGLKKYIAPLVLFIPVTILLVLPETLLLDPGVDGRLSAHGMLRHVGHYPDYLKAWVLPGSEPWVYAPYSDIGGASIFYIGSVVVGMVALVRYSRIGFMLLWPVCLLFAMGTSQHASEFSNVLMYPAMIGFALLLAALINGLPAGMYRTWTGSVAAVAILASFGITHSRNMDWKDEVFFWSRASHECTECSEPVLRLAQSYERLGNAAVESGGDEDSSSQPELTQRNWKVSENFYRLLDEMGGARSKHLVGYAQMQHRLGKVDEAVLTIERSLMSAPDNTDAIRALGLWHSERYSAKRDVVDLRSSHDYFSVLENKNELLDSDRLTWAIVLYQLGSHRLAGVKLQPISDSDVKSQAVGLMKRLNPRLNQISSEESAFNELVGNNALLPEILRARVKQYMAEGHYSYARYFGEELIRLSGNTNLEDWFSLAQSSSILGEWSTFVEHWSPPASESQSWEKLAEYSARQNQWSLALKSLMQSPKYIGPNARFDAQFSLAQIAVSLNNSERAGGFLQQLAQEYPKRREPWLALADIAIAAKQMDIVRDFLRQAASRGATQVELGSRGSRAGIQQSQTDLLERSTIQ
jgi:hypothetical protein